MRSSFQLQIMLIVALNLAFVQITGAVSALWLVPMYALTFASPWLVPLQDSRVYRSTWNCGVIGIFLILLVDASRNGISFLLEDGLILAAFCQVHLLNVIRRQVGADLLFFNSFLIALVTSLFCQDLAFSLVFVAYAVVLIVALHTAAVSTHQLQIAPTAMRRIVRDSVRRSAVVLVVTALAFAFWPRDFNRQGFVDDSLLDSVDAASPGFSEEIRLGQSAIQPVRQRVVMRIEVEGGLRERVPELWRGATLSYYDRRGWQGVHMPQATTIGGTDGDWEQHSAAEWTRSHDGQTIASLSVKFTEPVPRRLFLPLGTHRIRLDRPSYVEPLVDGTFRYNSGPPLSYDLEVEHGSLGSRNVAHLAGYRQLDRDAVPDALRDHLDRALQGLSVDDDQARVVAACEEYLRTEFSYLLPGERGAARNLADFLDGAAGGHCEYFATALALMLRSRLIPCRVVTGFRVSEWDEATSAFVVRDAHAHAWVEVWSRDDGWISADATPAAELGSTEPSWWTRVTDELDSWWSSLVRFDGSSRLAAWRALVDLPATLVRRAVDSPGWTLSVLALPTIWYLRRRRRRAEVDPAARAAHAYRRAVERAGLATRAAETPRELLTRARTSVEPELLTELEDATRAHEAARYAAESLPV